MSNAGQSVVIYGEVITKKVAKSVADGLTPAVGVGLAANGGVSLGSQYILVSRKKLTNTEVALSLGQSGGGATYKVASDIANPLQGQPVKIVSGKAVEADPQTEADLIVGFITESGIFGVQDFYDGVETVVNTVKVEFRGGNI